MNRRRWLEIRRGLRRGWRWWGAGIFAVPRQRFAGLCIISLAVALTLSSPLAAVVAAQEATPTIEAQEPITPEPTPTAVPTEPPPATEQTTEPPPTEEPATEVPTEMPTEGALPTEETAAESAEQTPTETPSATLTPEMTTGPEVTPTGEVPPATPSPTVSPTATLGTLPNVKSNRVAAAAFELCDPGPGKALTACIYNGKDLHGTDFSGSILTAATFNEANLTGANFNDTLLTATTFNGANLEGATFDGANVPGSATWGATTTCPDGSISGANGDTCLGHLEPIAAGDLTITIPLVADFDDRDVTGGDQTTTAVLDGFSVSDTRNSGEGWHVTAQAATFAGAHHDLVTGSLSMSQLEVTANGTSSPDPDVLGGPYTIDTDAITIASAALDEGMGTYDFGATILTLTIPANVYADTYTSTVTISVITAP